MMLGIVTNCGNVATGGCLSLADTLFPFLEMRLYRRLFEDQKLVKMAGS